MLYTEMCVTSSISVLFHNFSFAYLFCSFARKSGKAAKPNGKGGEGLVKAFYLNFSLRLVWQGCKRGNGL